MKAYLYRTVLGTVIAISLGTLASERLLAQTCAPFPAPRRCYWGFLLFWALIASPRLLCSQPVTFSKEVYNTFPASLFLALDDFNGDGFLDLATFYGPPVFYLGRADGSFGPGTRVNFNYDSGREFEGTGLLTGDFNGDGKTDVAVFAVPAYENPGEKVAVVLLGNGTGHFDSGSSVKTSLNFWPSDPVAGDFNGDGTLDIIVQDFKNCKTVLLPGDGDGGFGIPTLVTTAGCFFIRKTIVTDFNHDGKPDLAICELNGAASVNVLMSSGTGFTTAPRVLINDTQGMSDIVATDVNHDGEIDLVACVVGHGSQSVVILQGNGNGTFSIKPSRALNGAVNLAAGDFDGDGKIDLAISSDLQHRLQILFDDGSLQFPDSVSVETVTGRLSNLLTADFNRDGKLDLVGHRPLDGELSVYLNTSGSGSGGGSNLTLLVPIVLSSGGLNNSFFTSELTVTNRGPDNATIRFDYTAAFGGGGGGTATDTVAAKTQKIYPDAISYLRSIGVPLPESGNLGGTLRITFSGLSSSRDGAATVRTTTVVSNGRAGLAYNGVTSANLLNGTAYLCGLRQNSTDRSNAAFLNAGTSSDGPIRLRLTISSGELGTLNSSQKTEALSVQKEIDLEPGGFQQISGILAGYGITNGYVKVERISGTAPFYAYAIVNDQGNSDGSFVPPILESSLVGVTSLTLPVLVETSSFDSELVLTNFLTTPKTLQLSFVAQGIETSNSTAQISVTLQGGEQLILPHIIQQWRSQEVTGIGTAGALVGALMVVAEGTDVSGIFVGARTSMAGGGGRYGLFYTAIPRGKEAQSSAWLYGLQQNSENRTNLAVICTNEMDDRNPDVFRIDLYDGESGSLVGTVNNFLVNALEWKQIPAILSQYAPGVGQAYAHVVRRDGSNPFIVYAVINDGEEPGQRSGDGAFVSMDVE